MPRDAYAFLLKKSISTDFDIATGNHFESRPGLLNFSIVGRNANREQRKKYVEFDNLTNIHVQVADVNGEIRFLHTISEGPCDESYGVQVAALAGLPTPVVERARDLLIFLESQAQGAKAGSTNSP